MILREQKIYKAGLEASRIYREGKKSGTGQLEGGLRWGIREASYILVSSSGDGQALLQDCRIRIYTYEGGAGGGAAKCFSRRDPARLLDVDGFLLVCTLV